jgi:antitoxin VapB
MVRMALSIKTDEADALARELAGLTNESLTQAVTVALRERLERVRHSRIDIVHNLARLRAEYTAHAAHDRRTPDEILGYDEVGLPR